MMCLIDLLHQNYTCAAGLKTIPVTFCADIYLILNKEETASGAIQLLLLPQRLAEEYI